ncbi:MAG: hypothetical protein DHS20C02_19360 [Micavibrio sp.]|nr:MAG: hypothetical protein DHS20C02_19360 [Micavibrio sp.]
MTGKNNGSGNGHDKDEDDNVVRMPTLAERDRIRKQKDKQEKSWRKQYKKDNTGQDVPFFNAGKIPPLTRIIITLLVIVHLPLYLFVDPIARHELFFTFGFVPAVFTGAEPWSWLALVTPFTHLFIHGGWMHLVFNAAMMLVMGMFMETTFGAKRMLIFFFVSGISGALFYLLLNPFLAAPVIGASGSISGLFGVTFLLLYERGMMGPIGKRGPLPLIFLWMALITGMGMLGGDVAWQAHLGGFLGGLGLFYAMRKGIVRL